METSTPLDFTRPRQPLQSRIWFTDVGGRVSEIPLKRSVIEGVALDEAETARVREIIQHLVDVWRERALDTQ